MRKASFPVGHLYLSRRSDSTDPSLDGLPPHQQETVGGQATVWYGFELEKDMVPKVLGKLPSQVGALASTKFKKLTLLIGTAMAIHPVQLVFIQPTSFCNIDCHYCFLPDRSVPRLMSEDVLRRTLSFLFSIPDRVGPHVEFLWHAGEPLSVPLPFYENAFQAQREMAPPSVAVTNAFQTNGTLLDDRWCDLIETWGVRMGVSFDGLQEFHDLNRVRRSGKGTFDAVVKAIGLLSERGIPFHVTTVLTEASIDHPTELWELYRSLGITRIHFLIEELQGVHKTRILNTRDLKARLKAFFAQLTALNKSEQYPIYIRELAMAEERIRTLPVQIREIEQIPYAIINVSWAGNLSTLSPDLLGANLPDYGQFVLGNVQTSSFHDLCEHPIFKRTSRDILNGFRRCFHECEYFAVCGGGQPSIKYYENGRFDSTETPSCVMRIKAATDVVMGHLEAASGLTPSPESPLTARVKAWQEVNLRAAVTPASTC
jgi:uncharacterized protein